MGNENGIKLAIFDCSSAQMSKTKPVMFLLFEHDKVTAKELIHQRVKNEVDTFHQRRKTINTLVEFKHPGSVRASRLLDESLDADEISLRAFEAFEKNEFCIFVDDKQITELDESIYLRKDSQVEFFRLVHLVGG